MTSVEVLRSVVKPELVVIAVRGVTSSEGWSEGELEPLTRGTPKNGVLDLVLVAKPPPVAHAPTGYAPMFATLPLASGAPFKEVRVRSATNSVLLKELQGYTEVKAPAEACKLCVGKYFVAKGAAAPAGIAPGEIVRQEDLPADTRIILPQDGISDVQRNPDRLTIFVSENGRITDAAWQ